MQVVYNGVDYFSLIFESIIFNFFGLIGQLDGDGVVVYINGIMIIDLLLDMQYFMDKIVLIFQIDNVNYCSYILVISIKKDLMNY